METIVSPSPLFLRYELDQREIKLQQAAIDSMYFSADFKLVEHSLKTGDPELDNATTQFAQALMEFGINFEVSNPPNIQTFVTIEKVPNQSVEISKVHKIKRIHHFVKIDEFAAEKLVNICITKTNLRLSLTLFLSMDTIHSLSSALDEGKSLVLFTTNFSLLNLTS